jgi:hypothetical protein
MERPDAFSRNIPLHDQIIDLVMKKVEVFSKWRERATYCFGLVMGKFLEDKTS